MDVSSIVAGYLPAIVSVVTTLGMAIAMIKNVKDIVGNKKEADKKIANNIAEQTKKIDEVIVELKEQINKDAKIIYKNSIELDTLKEQNALLQEEIKTLKEQNETLTTIKDQQTVIMDRLRKE